MSRQLTDAAGNFAARFPPDGGYADAWVTLKLWRIPLARAQRWRGLMNSPSRLGRGEADARGQARVSALVYREFSDLRGDKVRNTRAARGSRWGYVVAVARALVVSDEGEVEGSSPQRHRGTA